MAPWPFGSNHDYLIQLDVLDFEGSAPEDPSVQQGEARVQTKWEIVRQRDGAVVAQGTTDFRTRWAVGDYAALVGLLAAGFDALATDLAMGLEKAAGER